MRVLDVVGLGFDSAVITIQGKPLLLLSADLNHEQRVGYMLGAMKDLDA